MIIATHVQDQLNASTAILHPLYSTALVVHKLTAKTYEPRISHDYRIRPTDISQITGYSTSDDI